MEISVTPRFTKSYKKLNSVVKEKAKVKERIFRKNPFDKRLKTHKLSGKGSMGILGRLFLQD